MLAVALSLPAALAVERAFVVSFAVALIVGERFRDAQRQRDAEALDAFLRALETPRGGDGAFAPTMHASLVRPPLGGPRPRALPRQPPPPPLAPSPLALPPHDRPTRVERR